MKVSYVTMAFPTPSQTFACVEVSALRRFGVDVSVYTMRGARATRLLREHGLGDLPLSQSNLVAVLRGLWLMLRHPGISLDLLRWIVGNTWRRPRHLAISLLLAPRSVDIFWSLRADRPDVVHLFWGHYPCLVGFLVQRHLRPTALSVFLGAYDLLRQFPGSALVACRADVVWTHAKCNVPALIGLGVSPTKIRVVYRGVDVAQFPMRDTAKVKGRVVTAGRLHPEKAMDDVLVAFSRILVTWPHGSMMVLGEGRDRSRLDGLVDSLGMCAHVTFRGHLSQDQVREEMSAAEVFVLMSRNASERLPNVVKEAMASGCVCVVTRTPGIDELVQDGVNGFVVEQGDVEAAARRISMALRTPERAAAMRAAAREWIVKRFDVTRSVALYRRRWEELVAERRLPPQTGMQARMRGRQRGATGTASARP